MTFEEWLTELRLHAMNSAAETRKIAADSWGSGYDTGYSDALEHVAAHFPSPQETKND
ncbi:MAG: hypothetical protein JWP25_4649 [Bradyrhizobium sp.]|nr:hypothetical protein [Bradyrhizobium sp.]